MRIRPFEYCAAKDLTQALEMLEQWGSEAKAVAGGTDLVLNMKKKAQLPRRVVSLHKVQELDFVQEDRSGIRIGALARHADLACNRTLLEHAPILCEAVGLIGSWQIRNVGTVGGNLCNASPAADAAAPLLVLGTRVVVANSEREEEVPLDGFFTGPGSTMLKPNELLKEIVIERPRGRSFGRYLKLRRRKAVDVSLVGVAFQAELDRDGRQLTRVAIGLGGVAPTPIRAPEAEAVLTGLSRGEALEKIPECARAAVGAMRPISDVRASAEYRRAVVDVYVRKAAETVVHALFDGGDAAK